MSLKAKHAIKLSLAMVFAYYIAMRFDWLSPTWVAISVAMVSLGSVGESVSKGVLRAKGTFLAFFVGLFLLAVFPQDRWLMLVALSAFLAFVTYKMTGKDGQYAWFVAGFVTLMIVTGAGQSSAHAFEFAAYRTLETLTGILTWTLISVFIWPQSNMAALHDTGQKLLKAQQKLLGIYKAKLQQLPTEDSFQIAHDQAIELLSQLEQAVAAANFENQEVRDHYQQWGQRKKCWLRYIELLARLDAGLKDIDEININKALPGVELFLSELENGFDMLASSSAASLSSMLTVDKAYLATLDHFQRSALEVLYNDLKRCAQVLTPLLSSAPWHFEGGLCDNSLRSSSAGIFNFVPLDPDRIKAALVVVASLWAGALLWIYVDPPGHIAWVKFLPNITLIVVQAPYMKIPLLKLFAVSYLLFMPVYVFIMPELSMFWELGLLIFCLCFLIAYFIPASVTAIFFLGVFNMLGISNEQSYNFASMMNTYVFTLLAVVVVMSLSLILGSSRPEKVFLKMIARYFHSSEIILSSLHEKPASRSRYTRMKLAYHQQELNSLPAKLGLWGSKIDQDEFPHTSPEKIQAIVTTLQALSYQIDDLCSLRDDPSIDDKVISLKDELRGWRLALAAVLANFVEGASAASHDELADKLAVRMERINAHCEQMISQGKGLETKDARQLYRLLGGFRRLSQEVIVYAGVTAQVNWADWRREHF